MQAGVARRCRPRPLSPESGAPTCEDVWCRRLSGRMHLVDREPAMGATSCGPLAVRGGLLGLRRALALELVVHVLDHGGPQPSGDALPVRVRADDPPPTNEGRVPAGVGVPPGARDVDQPARLEGRQERVLQGQDAGARHD